MVKTRYLIIGGTGNLGTYITQAAIKAGKQVRLLVRDKTPADSKKAEHLSSLVSQGVELAKGDITDVDSIAAALSGVDIVISAAGGSQIADQRNIIEAIKKSGVPIKRFIPSDFGIHCYVAPANYLGILQAKADFATLLDTAGIPFTHIHNGGFMEWMLKPGEVLGSGDVKAIFTSLPDVAALTIIAAEDERTVNKHVQLVGDITTQNRSIEIYQQLKGRLPTVSRTTAEAQEQRIREGMASNNLQQVTYAKLTQAFWIHGYGTVIPEGTLDSRILYPAYKAVSVSEYIAKLP